MRTLRRQSPVYLGDPVRELIYVVDEDIIDLAVHVREVGLGFFVDGDAEGVDPLLAGLQERLSRVLDAVVPLMGVPVLGDRVGSGLDCWNDPSPRSPGSLPLPHIPHFVNSATYSASEKYRLREKPVISFKIPSL